MGHYSDFYQAEEEERKKKLKPEQDKVDSFISTVRSISLLNLSIGDVYDIFNIISSTSLYDVPNKKKQLNNILKKCNKKIN